MTFVSIVLAILAERFFADVERYRASESYEDFLSWLRDRIPASAFFNGWPGAVILLLPGMIAVGVVVDLLEADGFWTGILSIAFSAAVLVWCFSAQSASSATERFLERYDMGDEDGARAAAHELLNEDLDTDARRWPGSVMTALFAQGASRFFGPLFWFAVFGPVGAIAFRTAVIVRERFGNQADTENAGLAKGIRTVYAVLTWIPARLEVLAFSLVGAFEEAFQGWRSTDVRCRDRMEHADEALAVCAGYGALGLEPDWMHGEDDPPLDTRSLRAALGLILRSVVVWVLVLGVLSVLDLVL